MLAELLGDIAVLLDRVDALPPEVHQATQTLSKAADRAAQTVVLVDGQLAALAKQAKVAAMQHVAKETHALFDRIAKEQRALMTEAARAIVAREVGPPLQRLAGTLAEITRQAHAPWRVWLTHAATAALAVAVTVVLYAAPWL